jgi:outer membrane protein
MKKLLLIAVVVLFAISANAQTQKGKFLFSGSSKINASFMTSKTEYDGQTQGDDNKITNITVESTFGYFVIDNLAIGLSTALDYAKFKVGSDETSTRTLMIGPTVRYYFGQSNFKPFAEGAFGLASTKMTSTGSSDNKFSGLAFQLGLGVGYFVNDKVSIDGLIDYQGVSLNNSEDSKYKVKSGGIILGIGFTICF